jgi:hypothetical protein
VFIHIAGACVRCRFLLVRLDSRHLGLVEGATIMDVVPTMAMQGLQFFSYIEPSTIFNQQYPTLGTIALLNST